MSQTSNAVEYHHVDDTDGNLFASFEYHTPGETPGTRYEEWVAKFPNGDRVTGRAANEVTRLIMNEVDGLDPGEGGIGLAQTSSMLDTVVWDDDSMLARITVRGVRVWFRSATDQGDDVVLYADTEQQERAGVIEDAPFSAAELEKAAIVSSR